MFRVLKKQCLFFLLLVLIIYSCTTGQCSAEPLLLVGGKLVDKGVKSQIPFEFQQQYIVVKTKINNSDKEYRFILDTGCSSVVISKKIASELHIGKWSPRVLFVDVGRKFKVASLPRLSIKIGDLEVRRCAVMVLDMSNLESCGLRVDGLIGNTFLKFLKLKIDYEHQLLTLSSMVNEITIEDPQAYNIKLFRDYFGLLNTKIRIGEKKYSAIIDTGANNGVYLNIPSNKLKKIKSELNCKLVNTIGVGLIGATSNKKGTISRVSSFQLGGYQAHNLPVGFYQFFKIGISNQFLSHFTVIINYPKLEMTLVPNKTKPIETNISSLGMVIRKGDDESIQITGIWEGSPAEKSGLKVGDVITVVKVNENTVHFEQLWELLKNKDQDSIFNLQVLSGNEKREVALKKADLLPEITEQGI